MNRAMNYYMNYARGTKKNVCLDALLVPLSVIGRAAVSVIDALRRHGLTKTEEPPLPVISVGNLTYGGTNKTPFTMMLAEFAQSCGIHAGIVTRGYSGKNREVLVLRDGRGDRELAGDEPLMLSRSLPGVPVAVSVHRIDGVRALKAEGVEVVIADDAFQHKILKRDADIVLIDASCPFGSGRVIPAGIMRETKAALRRADMVVLTKSEHVSPERLAALREEIAEYVPSEQVFTSRLELCGWTGTQPNSCAKLYVFSAVGSPASVRRTLAREGFTVAGCSEFRDHHRYTRADVEELCRRAHAAGAEYLACTEKDIYNLPANAEELFTLPLCVPKVKAVLNEPARFFTMLAGLLRPVVVVASNGYGEDAIGVKLAQKFRDTLKDSQVKAFPLVGTGAAYTQGGVEIVSARSVPPSGGVLKYSLHDLVGDMRAGLLRQVREQLADWQSISRRIRTPVCVGDVYMLLNALCGSGLRPMFCATAKTVYLSGHWLIERAIISRFTLKTWTRDEKSALQLGSRAVYAGSPVMDLLEEVADTEKREVILLLPGSRMRACKDVKMLLDAAEILSANGEHKFRMELAPSLPLEKFGKACEGYGWTLRNGTLEHNGTTIVLTNAGVARAAVGVKILLGLGGTANQLCAGLGIPVISIDEKGKRVQKKLLADSEILTEATGEALAREAVKVLGDAGLYEKMSNAGRERMGSPGALDDIVNYACEVLGWKVRESVCRKLTATLSQIPGASSRDDTEAIPLR